jgi:hypothetical protein
MTTLLKFLAYLLAKLLPTWIEAWRREQARKATAKKLATDKTKIDDFVKDAGGGEP